MTYSPILDAEMLPGKPPKSSLFFRLRDNVLAIIGRDGGPIVQVPVREYKTTGTGATWTIPAGVTAFNIYVGGGCGGNGGSPGASTVVYNGVTYTGGAGSNGSNGGAGGAGGAGGTATNGDRNITGQSGGQGGTLGIDGNTKGGAGGTRAVWGGNGATGTGGAFGNANGGGGGGGGMCIKRLAVVSGQTTATYTVGAGGTGADGGLIIFEY